MKVVVDERVKKFLEKLDKQNYSRAFGFLRIFEQQAFNLPENYLKKIGQNIWELRPGRMRIFLFIKAEWAVAVHAIFKKSQKILKKDFETINQRIRDWENQR